MTGKMQKALYNTFALSPSFAHHLQNTIRSQSNSFHPWTNLCSLSQMKLLIHKLLSLITKTRIKSLPAFSRRTAALFSPPSSRSGRSAPSPLAGTGVQELSTPRRRSRAARRQRPPAECDSRVEALCPHQELHGHAPCLKLSRWPSIAEFPSVST